MDKNNPLLDFTSLPKFNDIKTEHIEPALDYMLELNRKQIDGVIDAVDQPSWENFMQPLEEISDQLDKLWAPVSHLNAVRDSSELRDAYEACIPKLTEYASQMGQNKELYTRFKRLRESEEFEKFDQAQQKAIKNELIDFRLSGVDLDPKSKSRYRQISKELSDLSNRFSQNLLDATDSWVLKVEDENELKGLPSTVMELSKKKAMEKDEPGWLFSLHGPAYIPFMTYCDNRQLREQMYRAYATRASETGPDGGKWDNSDLVCRILNLRNELAELLGFDDYASYSVETKMATSPEEVEEFLYDLSSKSRDFAMDDINELKKFAKSECGLKHLEPWDMAWVSEKMKLQKYDISEEVLRPYFPLPTVLAGMFDIVTKLFGIQISEKSLQHKWHESVQLFEIEDQSGEIRGQFYIDLFARNHKRGGAWMAECIGRRKVDATTQIPVAFLTCNFTEPVNNTPSLLTHDQVMTLFHEFGHGLHHLLTRVDVASVSGINGVPWDGVELPSQFLENWCWQRQSLDMIARHYQTNDPISEDMLKKMHDSKNFQSAMQMQRQIEFSLFDLEIHRKNADISSSESIREILNKIRSKVAVVDTPEFNRFENGFGHIFSGGYAAGYYSYKWAEVLSSDAFGLFEQEGLFDQQTGKQFLETILEKGGSEDLMCLFVQFRGRKPNVDALLRHSGLS